MAEHNDAPRNHGIKKTTTTNINGTITSKREKKMIQVSSTPRDRTPHSATQTRPVNTQSKWTTAIPLRSHRGSTPGLPFSSLPPRPVAAKATSLRGEPLHLKSTAIQYLPWHKYSFVFIGTPGTTASRQPRVALNPHRPHPKRASSACRRTTHKKLKNKKKGGTQTHYSHAARLRLR